MTKRGFRGEDAHETRNTRHNPALSDHLKEITLIAEEAGMSRVWIVRGVAKPGYLTPELSGKAHFTMQLEEQGGVLLMLWWEKGDGGKPGVEQL